MSINEIQNNEELQRMQLLQSLPGVNGQNQGANGPSNGFGMMGDMLDVTGFGSIMSQLSTLGDEDQSALLEFGKNVLDSLRDGTFDAKSLADSAPDIVKQIAQDKGIDLTSALTQMGDKFKEHRTEHRHHGSPPERMNRSNLAEEEADYLAAVQQQEEDNSETAQGMEEEG